MQDARRQDILQKKARLEELKAMRKARDEARAAPQPTKPTTYLPTGVEDLVKELLEGRSPRFPSPPSTSRPESPAVGTLNLPRSSLGPSAASDVGSDTPLESMHPGRAPDLVEVHQDLFDFPQKEHVVYNKEVQTNEAATEPSGPNEAEIRRQLQEEHEAEYSRLLREKEQLEEQSQELDKEIENEIRELTEEERTNIYGEPDFMRFMEQSSKIVQRALSDAYDYIRDYSIGTESGPDDSEGNRVKRICAFSDDRVTANRSITDVDWSPKYPELSVSSYNKNPAALNEPDGIVAVWNLHLLERPEFVFHSQSDVLSVAFSPFHPSLIFGGSYSGQILLWDSRSKHLPVLKTPLSASGHTHPVYTMQMVGTQNAHNLITASTDGTVCSWLVDMLAQPQETLELTHGGHSKTEEVAVTALDFPQNETTSFWVGTEEGSVYQANRYDRAGSKAGLNQSEIYRAHSAPVTGLNFHPSSNGGGPVDFSDLFLTCSVDWTVKLWRTRAGRTSGGSTSGKTSSSAAQSIPPIYSFEESDDYVYDARWHPVHPAQFATADGAGKFDLWNLNSDTEVPTVSTTVGTGRAINKMAWEGKEGRRVALGSSDGKLYVYDIGDMATPRETDWADFQRTLGVLANSSAPQPVTQT